MKKFSMFVFIVMVALSFSGIAYAADVPAAPAQAAPAVQTAAVTPAAAPCTKPVCGNRGTYPAGPIQKAERGFMNTAFGWTEIPKRIVDKTRESRNPFTGLVVGGFQGSCKAFARTASGASELVTFPIGRYDKPQVLPDMPAAEQ